MFVTAMKPCFLSSGFDISGQTTETSAPVISKLDVMLGAPGVVTIMLAGYVAPAPTAPVYHRAAYFGNSMDQ